MLTTREDYRPKPDARSYAQRKDSRIGKFSRKDSFGAEAQSALGKKLA
jgi:hypothetical protein